MRKTYEELNELRNKLGTDRLWSWSRMNCTHNSLYEYYLKYIKHEPEDRLDSIYNVAGTMSHDIIERLYSMEITPDQMIDEFEECWTTAFDISELKFNRSDSEKNENIADRYHKNLQHFFTNHQMLKRNVALEQFVTVKVGNEWFQGYIDALTTDENGNYIIIDWKTSSIYLGEKAKNECGQLVLYAMALHQRGIPYKKIRICWNFLKYTDVVIEKPQYINLKWTTVKGEEKCKEKIDKTKLVSTLKASIKALLKSEGYDKDLIESTITAMEKSNSIDILPESVKNKIYIEECEVENKPRHIERSEIGEALQANVKTQMKKLGYSEDDIFEYLDRLIQTNDVECLPDDVKQKYTFSDCYVYVDLTEELIKQWEQYIIDTTKMIRDKEEVYSITHEESIWMEAQDKVKETSYYFANLCGYSANKHKPYKIYLDNYEKEKNGDLLGNNNSSDSEEDDMEWLKELL